MSRVIVIDSQPLIRAAIKSILDEQGHILVAETDNGVDGLRLVYVHRPDLVVLDISVPKISGMALMQKIYEFDKTIELLVLTSYSTAPWFHRCRAAHASRILSKNCSLEELKSAINRSGSGHDFLNEHGLFSETYTEEEQLIAALSDRELTTLQLLAQGMKNKEIAIFLGISNKTVSTYKTRVLGKLNIPLSIHLLEFARRHGLG
ncbi:response regulator [Pseudomonas sp. RT6P73]